MKRAWITPFITGCCFTMLSAFSHAAQTVNVSGAVQRPGDLAWQPGARLLNASIGATVADDAWYQGAALLRRSAMRDQRKLKRGILFDLQSAIVNARAVASPETMALLANWHQRVQDMPVTGRVSAELNPLKQYLTEFNPLLEPGDQIIYPRRPSQVRVMGAVQQDCVLDFVPARDPADYVAECALHDAANREYLYLVQPDGKVQSIGIAYWNAEDAWIAVGAVLYVPFEPAFFGPSSGEFNKEMATWLATQYQLTGGYSE